jgi:hypothetical protein
MPELKGRPAEPPLLGCPVLLEAAGGCGTSPRKNARPSDSPRRIPRHFCVTRRLRTGERPVKPNALRKPLVCSASSPLYRAEQPGGLAGFRRGLSDGRACLSRDLVPQAPRDRLAAPGKKRYRGALLFGYFLLGKQEKVTSRRAAPGYLSLGTLKAKLHTLRYA